MKILIASDIHGSLDALNFINSRICDLKPDMVVLLGDLVYHGPRNPLPANYDTCAMLASYPELLKNSCQLIAVRGNCDAEVDIAQLPFRMPDDAWLDIDGFRIYACHGHHLPDMPPIPNLPQGIIILRGHTHIPRAETIDGITFWNPGSISLPKGGYPATYGLYENGLFQVKDKAGNTILEHRPEKKRL